MEQKLIEKVRERRILYDMYMSEYRDQHLRLAAWMEIGNELQITGKKFHSNFIDYIQIW